MGKLLIRCAGIALVCALGACASSPPPVLLEASSRPEQYVWPVQQGAQVITSGYGERGGRGKSKDFHRGVDISAPRGTPVVAAAAGTVTVAGNASGYGHYLMIDHGNGTSTLYAHLLDFAVRRGDLVRGGATIGRVGKTGNATGYHLHFEVRRGTQTVDPRVYLP